MNANSFFVEFGGFGLWNGAGSDVEGALGGVFFYGRPELIDDEPKAARRLSKVQLL